MRTLALVGKIGPAFRNTRRSAIGQTYVLRDGSVSYLAYKHDGKSVVEHYSAHVFYDGLTWPGDLQYRNSFVPGVEPMFVNVLTYPKQLVCAECEWTSDENYPHPAH